MRSLRDTLPSILRRGRPVLRVQLTLLYSGLVLALIAAILLATNVLYGHTAGRAPVGTHLRPASSSHAFQPVPALIGLIAAVIALATAWWLAGRFLRPLRAITATAQQISATNLHQRLALAGPDDELTDLGRTLDDLFARLEASFESQRHFVANASHELRTPLAGQRTLLQVALADPDADIEMLRSTCEEALKLGAQQERLIDALLTLATSERGIQRFEPLDLAALADSVILGRQQDADQRHIHITASLDHALAAGDASLTESLIVNLIDNAVRHNQRGGRVDISTTNKEARAILTISNTGPTIPPDEIARLLQPFQRLGKERVGNNDGLGLGLPIVAAIAAAHSARLSARPRPEGGLTIEVSFPRPGTTPH